MLGTLSIARCDVRKLAVCCLLLLVSLPVGAVEDDQVMYAGGTLPALQAGVFGRLDTTSETVLLFECAGNKWAIPYARINSFEYYEQVARHLGVVPAIAVGLVKKRQQRHFFRISYRDDNNVRQVAVFEVPKQMPQTLLAVLQTRAPRGCKPSNQSRCNQRIN
jgi:hypothetical protein